MKGKGRGRKRKSTEPPSSPPPVEQEVTTTLTQNSSGKFVPKFSKKTKTCNSQTVNTSVAPAFPLHEEIETLYSSSPLKSHDIPWQLYDSTSQSLTTSPSKSCDKLSQSHGNNCSLSRDVEHVSNVTCIYRIPLCSEMNCPLTSHNDIHVEPTILIPGPGIKGTAL